MTRRRVPLRTAVEVVKAAAVNNISSTVVRKQLRENRSAKYLITDGVISYIQTHGVHELPQWRS